jgi:uncharacterized membrane protein YhfC
MDVLVRLLNSLLMFAIPLLLATWMVRRFQLQWRLFLIGAGAFIGAQLLHIPFNRVVLQPLTERLGLQGAEAGLPLVFLALLFGLSAGVFEEIARYIVYRNWLRDVRLWQGGVFFGLGHGGIEAMLSQLCLSSSWRWQGRSWMPTGLRRGMRLCWGLWKGCSPLVFKLVWR